MTPTIDLHYFILWSNEGVFGELWGAAPIKSYEMVQPIKSMAESEKVPSEMVNCAIYSQIVPPLASFVFPP